MTLTIALQNHTILTNSDHAVARDYLAQAITLAIENGLPRTPSQQQSLQAGQCLGMLRRLALYRAGQRLGRILERLDCRLRQRTGQHEHQPPFSHE